MIYNSSNAYSFPHGKKSTDSSFIDKSSLNKPPPGNYNPVSLTQAKAFHFSKEKKMNYKRPKTPGPGEYNGAQAGKFGKETPKFTVYAKEKVTTYEEIVNKKKRKPTPGPYDVSNEQLEQTIKKRTITAKFSQKSKEIDYTNKVPGVGTYNIQDTAKDFGKGGKGKFSMTTSNRSNIVNNLKNSSSTKNKNDIVALDPGYYTVKQDFGNNGVTVKIRGKPKPLPLSNTPGPGTYHQEDAKRKVMKTSPSVGLGIGSRVDFLGLKKANAVPAPGEYDPQINDINNSVVPSGRKVKFLKEKRMNVKRSQTPGPGSYKLPCSIGNTPLYSGINTTQRYV